MGPSASGVGVEWEDVALLDPDYKTLPLPIACRLTGAMRCGAGSSTQPRPRSMGG